MKTRGLKPAQASNGNLRREKEGGISFDPVKYPGKEVPEDLSSPEETPP